MYRTRSSIILWKYYIQFELLEKNLDKARSLFYRSIRECPWSKGIEKSRKIKDDTLNVITFLLQSFIYKELKHSPRQ